MKFRTIVLTAALALAGCQQTVTSSTIAIGGDVLSAEERLIIVAHVSALVAEKNGRCELRNSERAYHSCRFGDGGRYGLNVGYGPSGHYLITLKSTVVHFFPQGRDTVLSDRFLTAEHKRLESWMLSLLPAGTDYTAKRTYHGYKATEGLGDFSKDF